MAYKDGDDSRFIMTLGGKAAGFIYECNLDDPEDIGLSLTHAAPVGLLCKSHSGRFVMSGADDGSVRLQPHQPIGASGMAAPQQVYPGFDVKIEPVSATENE
eukprot:8801229-Pyramimonas_sp.AAC.1